MIYLNDVEVKELEQDWSEIINAIEQGVGLLAKNDYAQPLKVYLRYGSPKNRIIAMPAYVGFREGVAGLKWIASYPDNLKHGLTRANSVTILNNAKTGVPEAIINSSTISSVRTAAVSGFVLRKYLLDTGLINPTVGIVGFGPIGYEHYKMCREVLGKSAKFLIYDTNPSAFNSRKINGNTERVDSLEKILKASDVVITATNTLEPFISQKPKDGVLILNVSLRDFVPDYLEYVRGGIIVDDWTEVNREGTNIESFSKEKGLNEKDVTQIKDLTGKGFKFQAGKNYMFCPMGMAVFDMVIATFYCAEAIERGYGTLLN